MPQIAENMMPNQYYDGDIPPDLSNKIAELCENCYNCFSERLLIKKEKDSSATSP